MALEGTKGTLLERIWLSIERQPGYRVVIWNPRQTNVQEVVLGTWSGHSYDVSEWVESLSVTQNQVFENSDDAVSSRAQVKLVADLTGMIFPSYNIPINQKIFRDGTPIRIYQGDLRIDPDDWPPIFTGTVRGYPTTEVAKRGKRVITVQAFGRAQAYQTQTIVGKSFERGTDFGDAAVATAIDELRLEREEIRFGEFGEDMDHIANQLTQIGKMRGLYELTSVVGRKPYFDANGHLVTHLTSFDRPPIHILNNNRVVVSVSRRQESKSINNSVQVIGLDDTMTKVVQSSQKLGQVEVSTGYFDSHYREDIYWSKDKTRRAEDTFVRLKKKPDFFGGSVDWSPVNEFYGVLTIDQPYAPWVFSLMITIYVVLAYIIFLTQQLIHSIDTAIEDILLKAGQAGTQAAFVAAEIPIQALKAKKVFAQIILVITQIAQAAAQLLLSRTMARLGRYTVEIHGKPFENVYQELRSIAYLTGVNSADFRELTVTQHWLTEIEDVNGRAKELLAREIAKGHQYDIVMMSNAILEVDDIVEIRAEDYDIDRFMTFYITSIKREYTRASRSGDFMTLTAWLIGERDA